MKNISDRIAFAITKLGGAVQKLQSPDMDGRNANMAKRELKTCLRELVKIQSAIKDNSRMTNIYVNEEPFTGEQLRLMAERERHMEVTP